MARSRNGVATEVSAANKEKVVSIFLRFDRSLSDPRIDGNSLTVFFKRDESFKLVVVQGPEAAAGQAVPPALRSDALLLADVVRRFGQVRQGAVGAERHVRASLQVFVEQAGGRHEEAGEVAPGLLFGGVEWFKLPGTGFGHGPSIFAVAGIYLPAPVMTWSGLGHHEPSPGSARDHRILACAGI